MMMSKISTERDFNWKKSVNIYNVTENDHGNKSNKKGKEGRIRIKIILDDGMAMLAWGSFCIQHLFLNSKIEIILT